MYLEMGRDEGREVMTRGSLALKKGLAEGTLAGPGIMSSLQDTWSLLGLQGEDSGRARAGYVACGDGGVEPRGMVRTAAGEQGSPLGGREAKKKGWGGRGSWGSSPWPPPAQHPSSCLGPQAPSFLWPPHETPETQLQQVYCWRQSTALLSQGRGQRL